MNYFEKIFKQGDLIINGNITGLTRELKLLYLYNLYKYKQKNIIFVTNTLYEANYYFQALNKYTDDVLLFPMDDFLTSEALAISPELKTTRLETINELLTANTKIVITNLMGFLRYLPSRKIYSSSILRLHKNQTIDMKNLIAKLMSIGYKRETIVNKTGEISIRGYIVDIFPIGLENAVRIEFWGDEIDSIREFNVDNQLTTKSINEVKIYPNTEFLISSETNIEDVNIKYRNLSKYIETKGITDYLSNFIVAYDDITQLNASYNLLLEEMMEYSVSQNLDASTKYMNDFNKFKYDNTIYLNQFDDINDTYGEIKQFKCGAVEFFEVDVDKINNRLSKYLNKSKTVIICLDNRYKVNKILDEISNPNLIFTTVEEIYPKKINLIVKNITRGFEIDNVVVISESEIFNKKSENYKYKSNFKMGVKIRDINKLNIGDFVVHTVHGIGKYLGIKTLNKNGFLKDYLLIQYFGTDKLYIPVEKIEYISKYSSQNGSTPKLTKLGSTEWEKTKRRVKEKIESIAGDLLKLYAERESIKGISFDKDTEEQMIFEEEFSYKATADQIKVIKEIKADMEDSHPMDRLVCGDVGYGKTEVAFRAMFKAVMSSKQVALLCPTTILSSQHYENAIKRFSSFPVKIELFNRFVTPKKQKEIIKGLNEGKIDIVIGTHKLLSDEIKYKRLGLLVIDEEQRFGVKHKEKIKQYKTNVDVLTLSATPIPRTLQMSMTGLRNLSLIETPPVNRYPIQTYVLTENKQVIKDAIYKELSRGGQVYILYNSVIDMLVKKNELNKLLPDVSIGMAHGQMNKRELEKVMYDFHNKEYQVLLCTTIIETGIDIPDVNTIIIMDADRFGLSQLYQIRGRVGRSNKIAYCYLMYHPGKVLSEIANKRLQVIKDFTELGSGFAVAMRDLSIRGAGDILGSEQAGFVDTVGVELFLQMLQEEISILKGESVALTDKNRDTQPLIEVTTTISDKIATEEELKIEIHQKINKIDCKEKLIEVEKELKDRFGKLDDDIIIYMYEEWFEKIANQLNITNVKQNKNFVQITINEDLTKNISGNVIFMEATKLSRMFRFSMKNNCLVIILDIIKLDKHFIYYLVDLLEIIKNNVKKNMDN